MSGVQVSCPACGGPVTFPVGSAVVAVCPYCRSVVARGDRHVEDLGKVASLVETDSLLEVGRQGRHGNVPFHLTGRAQLAHPAGGVWDEWYAAFADNRWGWLAEAQRRFYLTFEQAPSPGRLPLFHDLELGRQLHVPGSAAPLTVAEKSHARLVSAEGAIPYRLEPGASYDYADLSGPSGEFATIDFGDSPPRIFVGREVTLDDLDIPATARPSRREARQVSGVQLNCPHCGGALALRAPDKSERVVCPNCGSLLDVSQGKLRYLETLRQGKVRPRLPLGSVGRLAGTEFMTIGFLQRSVRIEGVKYFWEEYLLYHARLGFRWLVCSDRHWSFVEPLPPGRVSIEGRRAYLDAKAFSLFQRAPAFVEHVEGEFYWKVAVGEKVNATDFIRPPQMLSREVTALDEGEGEVNWSLGTYLPVADLDKSFGVKDLPRPPWMSVAPNQPFLYKAIYLYWGLLLAAALVLLVIVSVVNPKHTAFEHSYEVPPTTDPEKPQVVFTDPFPLRAHGNLRVTVAAPVENTWLGVEGDLIQEESDLVQPFSATVEYYHGVEDGECWQEGSQEATVYLSAPPAGSYRLRLEFVSEGPTGPAAAPPPGSAPLNSPRPAQVAMSVRVRVEQGVVHAWTWLLTVLALSIVPVGVAIYQFFFERQRWEDSEFSPFHS